jgi:esterase/lipase
MNSQSILYLIPGQDESINAKQYLEISKFAKEHKINCIICDLQKGRNASENNITQKVKDFISVYKKTSKQYDKKYFLGFSFGALTGLITSTKLHFDKQIICSCALFAENKFAPKGFLDAWKELNQLPDYDLFLKGKIKSSKQKLKYIFVKELQKYKLEKICEKINCETILLSGENEPKIKKQNKQIYKLIRTKKKNIVVKNADHEINANYLKEIKNILRNWF